MSQATVETPIGILLVEADDVALASLAILTGAVEAQPPATALLREAVRQLQAYFSNRLRDFDLPLIAPATPRGAAHRQAIVDVGYGDTRSYDAIARTIWSSPRAVGQACRRNPLPIVIPCHRVVAAQGQIGHYSAGKGLETKLWLIDHERRRI